jgi:hypothetical protein
LYITTMFLEDTKGVLYNSEMSLYCSKMSRHGSKVSLPGFTNFNVSKNIKKIICRFVFLKIGVLQDGVLYF